MTEQSDNQQNVPQKATTLLSQWRRNATLPGGKTLFCFWAIVVVGVTLDLWTKSAVFEYLRTKSGNTVSVIDGFFHLVLAVNEGAAFGIAAGRTLLLSTVSVVALVVILVIFFCSGKESKLMQLSLALFVAGICGNLYDRIFNDGFVRDFLDVYYKHHHWPAFNVADSMLCIGVGLMLISSFFAHPEKKTS